MLTNLPANSGVARDGGSVPRSGRFLGVENDNPLENSMTEETGGLQSMESQSLT